MSLKVNKKIVTKSYKSDYSDLYASLEYVFVNKDLLFEALTHPSCRVNIKSSNKENKQKTLPFNYERLEFLGDRILGFILGKNLFNIYKNDSEGMISKRFANVACGEIATKIGYKLQIEQYIVMSDNEETCNGRGNKSIIEDVVEAIIGAIFLDSDIEIAEKFILRHWNDYIFDENNDAVDVKSKVQNWSQINFGHLPKYHLESLKGPDHMPEFCISIEVNGHKFLGTGSSKKEAEKAAANNLVKKIKIE